ncbi:MAG: hypothetical protein KIT08_08690 [Anaerolineales bacterium]|nr:MAG: hypothetical protein KIT08_08690 [Anaerolineales bacterium]
MSKGRIFLFLWDETEAEAAALRIRAWGWDVELEWQDGGRGSAAVKASLPDAVVLYLDRKPSHSRATAEHLAEAKATRNIPLLFVGGEDAAVEQTRAKLPEATYTSEADLQTALEELTL